MRVFAIKDDTLNKDFVLGYLVYYETSKKFYIELKQDIQENELPILLNTFVSQGHYTINSYWSFLWVNNRIVPSDRQNIASILKAYKLDSYDEFKLLITNKGRCEQDSCYLEEFDVTQFPTILGPRLLTKVDNIIPLTDNNLLVAFFDGSIKKCNIPEIVGNNNKFKPIFNNIDLFKQVKILPGGYEVVFCDNLYIADLELYTLGIDTHLTHDDLLSIYKDEIINVKQAQEILTCSRQNISDLIKRKKLHPIKESDKDTLLLKSEVIKRNWK